MRFLAVALLGLVAYLLAPVAAVWTAFRLGRRGEVLRRRLAAAVGLTHKGDEGIVFQSHATACGAACLEMVMRRFWPEFDPRALGELRAWSGTSMLDLQRALTGLGVASWGEAVGGAAGLEKRLNGSVLAIVPLDMRLYLRPRSLWWRPWGWIMRRLLGRGAARLCHWVVVTKAERSQVEILDPYLGRLTAEGAALDKSWAGAALLVQVPGGRTLWAA
jgi:hypothetical protein